MQVINSGTRYTIHDGSIKTFTMLPPKVYKVNFSQNAGYSLVETDNIEVHEKIYGNHINKVEKVFESFKIFPRNLGVILSGAKGIGKSLFSKLLAIKAIENGYPIIFCDTPYVGLADFLGSIQQECVILFDEFDKTFKSVDGIDPQVDLLTLFDGMYMGKKLFIITCNQVERLNEFLVNRPGRFHYHFRFSSPNAEEITEYLQDNVSSNYWGEIEKVVEFSTKISLNFDCLRAIAFELNLGISFSEAIKDLNIINTDNINYIVTAFFEGGTVFELCNPERGCIIDMFKSSEEVVLHEKGKYTNSARLIFNPTEAVYDYSIGAMIIKGSDIDCTLSTDEYYFEDSSEDTLKLRDRLNGKLDFITLKRASDKVLHYMI